MDQQAVDAFKSEIRTYVSFCEELDALGKQASVLRKQKKEMESKVMQSMRTFEVDVCQVQHGKVVMKTSKRCGSIKPKVVMDKITEFFGDDSARAERLIKILEDSREMSETQVVRYNKKRSRATMEGGDEDSVSVTQE